MTHVRHDADSGLDAALGDAEPDFVVLTDVRDIAAARRALARRGWKSRLVALWTHVWPQHVESLADVLEHSDLTVFTDHEYWRNIGCPFGTVHGPVLGHDDASGEHLLRALCTFAENDGGAPDRASARRAGSMLPGRHDSETDLSDRLTVFLTSVGASTFRACLHLLDGQDCRFRLEIIENVAPMSAAFQQMLDRCETAFYAQIDEDMLLYPHAVRTLFEGLERSPEFVAMYGEPLFDAHLGRTVSGVKISRHAIVKKYPFRDTEAFELDHLWRLKKDGFEYIMKSHAEGGAPADTALGLHGTNFTPQAAYVRYYKLQYRQRLFPTPPWANLLTELADIFRAAPSELNFHALAGALAGKLASQGDEEPPGARDYRDYSKTPGLAEVARLYEHLMRNEV